MHHNIMLHAEGSRFDHVVHEPGGFLRALLRIKVNAGERRIREFAYELIIVDAEYSHLIGDTYPRLPGRFGNVMALVVVACHQANWLRQRFQPFAELGWFVVPEVLRPRILVFEIMDIVSGFMYASFKALRALTRPHNVVESIESKVCEALL